MKLSIPLFIVTAVAGLDPIRAANLTTESTTTTRPITGSPTTASPTKHPDSGNLVNANATSGITDSTEAGTCGDGSRGNGVCAIPKQCCSKWGWCGADSHHCQHPASGDIANATSQVSSARDQWGGKLGQLLADTHTVTTTVDWEWVLIRINGVQGQLSKADFFTAADSQVVVTAVNATPVDFFNKPLTEFESIVEEGTDTPEWFELGMVAFPKDSVSQLEVVLKDVDSAVDPWDDTLIKKKVDLPTVFDQWVDILPEQNDYALNISLWRTTTPVITEAQQAAMGLTEVVFDLLDGSKAVLVYKTAPNNSKAVLYFPGRNDAFAHPNVLQMYQRMGYDFYSIDPRFCGRARRFLDESNFRTAHSIDNFDNYKFEIDLAMDFIRTQNQNYTQLVAHAHSTGALVVLNYAMLMANDPFDGYILNGPFLDWGHRASYEEFAVERLGGTAESFGIDVFSKAEALNTFHMKNWIVSRWNTTQRPIFIGHVFTEWAQAVTRVHNKILRTPKSHPITDNPVLLIASSGDTTVETTESEDRMPHIVTNYTSVILPYSSHDVTLSRTEALNEVAIAEISKWLENPEPNTFGSDSTSTTVWVGIFLSFLIGFLSLL